MARIGEDLPFYGPATVFLLIALSQVAVFLGIALQIRLNGLGLNHVVEYDLPDLPDLPVVTVEIDDAAVERLGEGDLLYPESFATSPSGDHGFMSLGDGRIVRMDESGSSWQTVVRTGTTGIGNRQEVHGSCGGGGPADVTDTESRCGRPLGLWMARRSSVDPAFERDEQEDEDVLLVADGYAGFLMVTGIYGSGSDAKVHTLATRANTDPADYKFNLLNAIVQLDNGDVYVTETSQRFHRRRIFHAFLEGKPTGRLMRYRSGIMEVVAEDIFMANGISLSHDGRGLLVVSGVSILRYDLETGRMDPTPFVEAMPGTGDNIKTMDRLPDGREAKCYWAALGGKYAKPFSLPKYLSDKKWLRSFILAVTPYRLLMELIPKWTALVVYDDRGTIIDFLRSPEDDGGKLTAPWVSEMEPFGDHIYLLSWYNPFLARFKKSAIKNQSQPCEDERNGICSAKQ